MSHSNFMLDGQLLRMMGVLLQDLNQGTLTANTVFQNILDNKFSFIQNTSDAVLSSGTAQSWGQLCMGIAGIVGGGLAIGGGVVGIGGAISQASELSGIANSFDDTFNNVGDEVQGNLERPVNNEEGFDNQAFGNENAQLQADQNDQLDANRQNPADIDKRIKLVEKELAKETALARGSRSSHLGNSLMQLQQAISNGGGSGANAYFAHTQAQGQAAQTRYQGLSEVTGQQMGSTESAQQNTQSFFSQAAGFSSQYMQYVIALSQAH